MSHFYISEFVTRSSFMSSDLYQVHSTNDINKKKTCTDKRVELAFDICEKTLIPSYNLHRTNNIKRS